MNASTIALATRIQIRDGARWVPWPAAAIMLAWATIAVGVEATGTLFDSFWAHIGWVLVWLPFAAGIGTGAYLPVLVAHGISRRNATAASGAAMFAFALALAMYVQLGYAVEWLGFRALDRSTTLEDQHLFTEATQVHLVLAEYTLLFAGYLASGWLVWAGYYRFGARATVALPLAMLPGFGSQVALMAGSTSGIDIPAALALALAAVAAGVAAMTALARTIPLKAS
jgi:hypothetical protein